MRIHSMILILSICVAGACFAQQMGTGKVAIRDVPLITGKEDYEVATVLVPRPKMHSPFSTDDYVGEVDTVGTTWYDSQHSGSCGRMIRVDSQGLVHVVWMNGLDYGAVERHVYYNVGNNQSGWTYGNSGTAVDFTVRSGYTTLAIDSEDNPFVAFHVMTPSSYYDHHAAVATIPSPFSQFSFWECPYVYQGGYVLEIIWPKIAIDRHDRIHLINTENPSYSPFQRIYYCRGEFDTTNVEIDFIDQQAIDFIQTMSADITANRYSDRVAFVYSGIRPAFDTTMFNNDIRLVISEDGLNWDFSDYINVTDFIPPDPSLLPDTTAANKDTLRAYTDASVMFDADDNVHVAFTTPYYDAIRGLVSWSNSLIWHWCDATGYFSLVADGWFDEISYISELACGAWQRYVQRPCLAMDENTGDLFIVYQKYDTSDVAENGYPQGEIMISRSTNNGISWSVGTNVSNTHAPGATAWNCLHEREITCNETVEDGALHLLYVMDNDAGSIPQNEGLWTLSAVQYQRVPINEIPTVPLMPRYPMHVDSTGFPPESLSVDISYHGEVPGNFHLYQNYPNPFNSSTMIKFDVYRMGQVSIKMYDILGREVATLVHGRLQAGSYSVVFDGDEFASGIYFCQLRSESEVVTRKMVLVK